MSNPPQPHIQINCFADVTTLTRFENGTVATCAINLNDLALHLTPHKLSTGLLPKNVLAWSRESRQEKVVVYIPRSRPTVAVRVGSSEPESLTVPLPPAVFVGRGTDYRVFAVKRRPRDERTRLYRFPAPNVGNGAICFGGNSKPKAGIGTMTEAWQLFLTTAFNTHNANGRCHSEPNNILKLWRKLHREQTKRFPLLELVPSNRRLWDVL